MKALRLQVERVVRPLCASERTKARMRAELYEHLQRIFQEELARSDDEATALEQAARRFGDPTALSAELQAGVPRLERWALTPFPGTRWGRRRPGESVAAWILRTVTAGAFGSGAAIALVVAAIASIEHRWDRMAQVAPFLLATPALLWVSLVSVFWFCELLRRELRADPPRGRVRAVNLAGAGAFALVAMLAMPVCLLSLVRSVVPFPLISNSQAVWACAIWALVTCVLLAIQARDWMNLARRYEEWDSLEIETN